MKKIVTYSVIGLAIVGFAWLVVSRINSSSASTEVKKVNKPPVNVELAKHQDLEYKLAFSGDVNPAMQANVFSKISGTVEHLYADMGQAVMKGQVLAIIDTAALGATVGQTLTTYQNTRIAFNRTKALAAQGLAAQQELENAQTAMNVAKDNYSLALTQLDYARIRAPFSGIITRRYLDAGAVVSTSTVASTGTSQSNSTLFTIMDLSSVKVLINVLDKDVPSLAGIRKAEITIDALPGKTFEGYVTRTSESISTTTRTETAEVTIQNRDHTIKPGMFARVDLLLGAHPNALTLPTEAVLKDAAGQYVYVVDANSIAHRTSVTIGIEQDNRTEILTGITGTESVIVTGQNFVKDKAQVAIQK